MLTVFEFLGVNVFFAMKIGMTGRFSKLATNGPVAKTERNYCVPAIDNTCAGSINAGIRLAGIDSRIEESGLLIRRTRNKIVPCNREGLCAELLSNVVAEEFGLTGGLPTATEPRLTIPLRSVWDDDR